MSRKSKMAVIIQERGKPLSEVLISEYSVYQNLKSVAVALGVSEKTVQDWLMRCQLEIVERRELVKREVVS